MRMRRNLAVLVILSLATTYGSAAGETVWLSALDMAHVSQGWGKPQIDKSVEGKPMSIGGRAFEKGLGTHAPGAIYVDLQGGGDRFTAFVGADDERAGRSETIAFVVIGDGKLLFESGLMKPGDAAKEVNLDIRGMRTLSLIVEPGPDGISHDHADWADAKLEYHGPRPATIESPPEEAVIFTPKPPAAPRINGPKVYGARPGSPFLFTIPATGERPMEFSADGLPLGLRLDTATGIITGAVRDSGQHRVILRAKNAHGEAQRALRIVAGNTLALTPPMGWNSWYCFYDGVTDRQMREAADAMVNSGMIQHGYAYVNIDDGWMVKPGSDDRLLGGEPLEGGAVRPNGKFPDMKALTEYIHAKGLKAGLYTSPGPTTCAGFAGSFGHEVQDARRFSEWGFDFLKYDLCSYGGLMKDRSVAELRKPYDLMNAALRTLDRDFIYNLCQYGLGEVWTWGAKVGGHSWRTTGDLGASSSSLWGNIDRIGFSQNGLEKWAGPGHWNDPDYLLIGHIGWKGSLRPTPLTPNEQYAHVSLWSLLAAPLILSGDMTQLDAFTLSLLTNDEVIEVNQDSLGRQARRVKQDGAGEVWLKEMEDGSLAVGLFNRGELPRKVVASWADLGLRKAQIVRDVWRQKDLGRFEARFEADVPRHGVVFVRLRPTTE